MPKEIDVEKLAKQCPIMVLRVWGSDQCILRKADHYRDSDIEEVAARLLELGALLDNFASGKVNSDDWKKVEKISGKRFFINHDGKTSTARSGHEA